MARGTLVDPKPRVSDQEIISSRRTMTRSWGASVARDIKSCAACMFDVAVRCGAREVMFDVGSPTRAVSNNLPGVGIEPTRRFRGPGF